MKPKWYIQTFVSTYLVAHLILSYQIKYDLGQPHDTPQLNHIFLSQLQTLSTIDIHSFNPLSQINMSRSGQMEGT